MDRLRMLLAFRIGCRDGARAVRRDDRDIPPIDGWAAALVEREGFAGACALLRIERAGATDAQLVLAAYSQGAQRGAICTWRGVNPLRSRCFAGAVVLTLLESGADDDQLLRLLEG
jgi:hypothetical protein